MLTNGNAHILNNFVLKKKADFCNIVGTKQLEGSSNVFMHLGFKTIVLKIILVISLIRGWPELESSRVDVEASISGGETSWDELIILWHAVAAEKKKT